MAEVFFDNPPVLNGSAEDKLRQLISTEFTKILPDFADYADDELEQIIMAAMQSKECRDKIREIRNSSAN